MNHTNFIFNDLKKMAVSAIEIVNNARRIGLNITSDLPTLGDGNCFYRAVVQQLKRSTIRDQTHIHTPLQSNISVFFFIDH